MKVSIVFEDGMIVVDGVSIGGFDLSSEDPNWRALQWRGDHGWIEVHRGDRIWLTDAQIAQRFIDMHKATAASQSTQ